MTVDFESKTARVRLAGGMAATNTETMFEALRRAGFDGELK